MNRWVGLALALRGPEDDALHSRLPTYAHPLAGRSLGWHVLRALSQLRPSPAKLILATTQPLDPALVTDLGAELVDVEADDWWDAVERRLDPDIERLFVVDAAAATLGESLATLVEGAPGRCIVGEDGEPLGLWIEREDFARRVAALPQTGRTVPEMARLDPAADGQAMSAVNPFGDPAPIALLAEGMERVPATELAFIVRDRVGIARATATIRDRNVRRHMEAGVTILLPESVLIDVQVRIGADTVIYPGAVLEGETTIGAETVIGPGCRIIDSWVGSGVELKGWNYISGTNLRNRAVLEPYVRRGFD